MLSILTWRPDTCECEIHMQYDDAIQPSVYSFADQATAEQILADRKTANPQGTQSGAMPQSGICDCHTVLGMTVALYDALRDESKRKNIAYDKALGVAAFNEDEDDDDFTFSYDDNLLLHVSITTFTAENNTSWQTALDAEFGAGKAVVDG